jgi:uncharacterized membrane protein YkvA (DUF1232 family)
MRAMGNDLGRMKDWIDSFAQDVDAVKKDLEGNGPRDARKLLAGALNYLVTRMDIIPDWEETCGVLDDAMVLRVAAALASEKGLETSNPVARLANEADVVSEFLGKDLYPRFKRHVEGLTSQTVRGRAPDTILDDAKARAQLYDDIKNELAGLPPAPMTDPDAVARTIRSYFSQKLRASGA